MSFSSANVSLPREIPSGLKWQVFFSNPVMWMGFVFFLVGSVFMVVFNSQVNWADLKFKGGEPTVKGKVLVVEQTNASENKRTIYAYHFSYTAPDGKSRNGISYRAGGNYSGGDEVDVEYLASDPSKARIVGMRMGPFSPWVSLTGLFAVAGIITFFAGIRTARKNIRLLQNGWMVNGKVTGKEPTSSRINGRRVYKVMFEFEAEGIKRNATVRTHRPERLGDEANERVLYNPYKPDEAVMLDSLPKSVRGYFDSML